MIMIDRTIAITPRAMSLGDIASSKRSVDNFPPIRDTFTGSLCSWRPHWLRPSATCRWGTEYAGVGGCCNSRLAVIEGTQSSADGSRFGTSRPCLRTQRTTHTFSKENAAEIAVRKSLHAMKGRKGWASGTTNTIRIFQQSTMPDETLEADIKGWLDKSSQGVIQHDGQFVLTNKRACFYSEAPFEEIFDIIRLSKITSVQTSSLMGYPCPPCSHG